MQKPLWALAGMAVLIAHGCSRAPFPTAPESQSARPPEANLGSPVSNGGLAESALGLFTITVEPELQSATITLDRRAQASGNTYELSIEDFIRQETIQVLQVTTSPTTVDILLRVEHPLPAPQDLNGPVTGTNRADLGAALRLLFLQDVPQAEGFTWFAADEPVILNPGFVANAHGYVAPAGLLQLPSNVVANTFPYLLVVDEAANDGTGNREGILGVAGNYGMGNYDPANGGWQRHNIGATHNGWTGFGILHQGQAALVPVRLSRSVMSANGPFVFRTALLAKYIDPRSGATAGERRSNRLPGLEPDASAFAYRMPYGALDLEAIRFLNESGGWRPNQATSTNVRFTVRDWDTRASESTQTDLRFEPNINLVQGGGSGFPAIEIDAPGVLPAPIAADPHTAIRDDDSPWGGDPMPDTGLPGDPLVFEVALNKPAGTGQSSQTVMALLRLTDPEDQLVHRTDFNTPVDKSLNPLPVEQWPRVRTYQILPLLMGEPNGAPNASAMFQGGVSSIVSGGTLTIQVLSYADPEGNPGTFMADFDNSGGFFPEFAPVTITTAGPFPQTLVTSAPIYNNSSVNAINRVAEVQYTDGHNPPRSIFLPFAIGGNQPPSAQASLAYADYEVSSPMELILTNIYDNENNSITFDVNWEWDGTEANFAPSPGFANVPASLAMAQRPAPAEPGYWLVGIRVKDPLHQNGPILSVPYRSRPPNNAPTASFITPPVVESASTTTVTCVSFFDPDGDPVFVRIDWEGNGVFVDAAEPLTDAGQMFTSPVLYNRSSPMPLAPRTITVMYSDGVAPHEWTYTTAGDYVLGGNKPPQVTGSPVLESTPLPSPAIFNVLQGTATFSDPEGDPITFTLRAVPNSGSATNTSFAAFPRLSNTYNYPNVTQVTFTVYANDQFHSATTGTPFPALIGQVCTISVVQWLFDSDDGGWTPGFGGLPNNDAQGWSAWTWCNASGQGLSGKIWTTGPDAIGPCTNHPDDYGGQLDNNIVSPAFSLAGLSKANLVFNSSMAGRGGTSCRYRIYVSTNGGTSWTPIYDYTKSSANKQNNANLTVNLASYLGQSNVRLRFQLSDTSTDTWGMSPYAGWSIDNVRVTGCP